MIFQDYRVNAFKYLSLLLISFRRKVEKRLTIYSYNLPTYNRYTVKCVTNYIILNILSIGT